MSTVFYNRFERHAGGQGLKEHATHYCPGCGHGLAHKFLAEAIEELGIQDRTIAISPVGCSVFLYYYFDVGNSQAAHGRAPVVAVGHKLANPDSIVVSYQGDGDLASIGLAEIVHTAQMGLPLSVVFVNNGTYAMTGGQLAPTTLLGQQTTTTPEGRTSFLGEPMKVAELIAGLDGPVYVERVALYDGKQRNRAKKAIRRALAYQVEGHGFSFVEVLAECPVQLHMDPVDAERWVKERMTRVFPLGVLREPAEGDAPHPPLPRPRFDADELFAQLGTVDEAPARHASGFPEWLDADDVAIKFAGAGGDGAQTVAMLTTRAAIAEGWDSTHIPSYGPESRGGTSYADVHLARDEVLSPAAPAPHVLVAFNAPSLQKFGPAVRPGGTVIYDSTVIDAVPELADGVRAIGVPCSELAAGLGARMAKNVVALGAMQAATRLVPPASLLDALEAALASKPESIELNRSAFELGAKAVAAEG